MVARGGNSAFEEVLNWPLAFSLLAVLNMCMWSLLDTWITYCTTGHGENVTEIRQLLNEIHRRRETFLTRLKLKDLILQWTLSGAIWGLNY